MNSWLFTFAAGVEKCCLETDIVHIQIVLDRNLNAKPCIWADVWKWQKVSRPNKEVAMERVNTKTCQQKKTKLIVNSHDSHVVSKSGHYNIADLLWCSEEKLM